MCQTIQTRLEFVSNIEYIFGPIKRKKEKCNLISGIVFKTIHLNNNYALRSWGCAVKKTK